MAVSSFSSPAVYWCSPCASQKDCTKDALIRSQWGAQQRDELPIHAGEGFSGGHGVCQLGLPAAQHPSNQAGVTLDSEAQAARQATVRQEHNAILILICQQHHASLGLDQRAGFIQGNAGNGFRVRGGDQLLRQAVEQVQLAVFIQHFRCQGALFVILLELKCEHARQPICPVRAGAGDDIANDFFIKHYWGALVCAARVFTRSRHLAEQQPALLIQDRQGIVDRVQQRLEQNRGALALAQRLL